MKRSFSYKSECLFLWSQSRALFLDVKCFKCLKNMCYTLISSDNVSLSEFFWVFLVNWSRYLCWFSVWLCTVFVLSVMCLRVLSVESEDVSKCKDTVYFIFCLAWYYITRLHKLNYLIPNMSIRNTTGQSLFWNFDMEFIKD